MRGTGNPPDILKVKKLVVKRVTNALDQVSRDMRGWGLNLAWGFSNIHNLHCPQTNYCGDKLQKMLMGSHQASLRSIHSMSNGPFSWPHYWNSILEELVDPGDGSVVSGNAVGAGLIGGGYLSKNIGCCSL
jgi:hypothetical protein